jgi:N-acylglucosamine-6-phosphate 2-epimerase
VERTELWKAIQGGVVVSCQALPQEPLHGPQYMARMAVAAVEGGALGIRANGAPDIYAIREAVRLPIIGLKKLHHPDSDLYITATLADVLEIARAGADCVAVDFTNRARPGGQSPEELMAAIRDACDVCVMADISTYEEGIHAQALGVDLVSTTLSGYTPYSPQQEEPDYALMRRLAGDLRIPVCGEGRIWTREQAARALDTGVHALIIGSSITRPQDITRRFVQAVATHARADARAMGDGIDRSAASPPGQHR